MLTVDLTDFRAREGRAARAPIEVARDGAVAGLERSDDIAEVPIGLTPTGFAFRDRAGRARAVGYGDDAKGHALGFG